MHIVLLSDTHCRLRKIEIPQGDLLLHAGDLTFSGNHIEIHQELRELGRISKNFKYGCVFISIHIRPGEKIFTRRNFDFLLWTESSGINKKLFE